MTDRVLIRAPGPGDRNAIHPHPLPQFACVFTLANALIHQHLLLLLISFMCIILMISRSRARVWLTRLCSDIYWIIGEKNDRHVIITDIKMISARGIKLSESYRISWVYIREILSGTSICINHAQREEESAERKIGPFAAVQAHNKE